MIFSGTVEGQQPGAEWAYQRKCPSFTWHWGVCRNDRPEVSPESRFSKASPWYRGGPSAAIKAMHDLPGRMAPTVARLDWHGTGATAPSAPPRTALTPG